MSKSARKRNRGKAKIIEMFPAQEGLRDGTTGQTIAETGDTAIGTSEVEEPESPEEAQPRTEAPVAAGSTAESVPGESGTSAEPVIGAAEASAGPVPEASSSSAEPVIGAVEAIAEPVRGASGASAEPVSEADETIAEPVSAGDAQLQAGEAVPSDREGAAEPVEGEADREAASLAEPSGSAGNAAEELLGTALPREETDLTETAEESDTETAGTEVASADKQSPGEAKNPPSYVPGRRKVKKRWIILGAVGVALLAFLFVRSRASRNVGLPVEVLEATTGSIEETVVISGNVASAEKKSYFSTVSAPVRELNIKAGDRVEKGDVLFSYDAEDLALLKRQAELNIQQAKGSYSGSMEKNAKATDVLRGNSIHDINNRLDEITAQVDAINSKITAKSDRISGTITELQNTLLDINQNGIGDSSETAYATVMEEDVNNKYITRRESSDNDPAGSSNRQMSLAVQQSLNEATYALQHDPEITKWRDEITALNEEKAKLTEQKSVETSRLTGGEQKALSAQKELAELSGTDTIEDIEAAEEGVRADFSGVVTAVTVEEGATAAKGTKLLSLESTDDVEVTLQISKADMTKVKEGQKVDITVNGQAYEGEVTHISGSATKNASGVPVVDAKIKINDPDDKIILGVEASNKIHTAQAEGVIVIPYEYVGADSVGDYVFVAEDGVAKRRDVVVGLTTATEAEIVEGISAGDLIITGNVDNLEDGMPISVQTSGS